MRLLPSAALRLGVCVVRGERRYGRGPGSAAGDAMCGGGGCLMGGVHGIRREG